MHFKCFLSLLITYASAVSIDITYPVNGSLKLSVNGVIKELGRESIYRARGKTQHQVTIPAINQSSDAWRPLVLTECVEGMPPEFAPCLKRSTLPNLVYAEEVSCL